MPEAVVAIFDIGKTNKKLFLINEDYQLVFEASQAFPEIHDEDGVPCENMDAVVQWMQQQLFALSTSEMFDIRALNFSGYGATFVHLNDKGQRATHVYNYLKGFPPALKELFFTRHGQEATLSAQLASPSLGMLNSGLQLYWLKYIKPEFFETVRTSLHLPQYLSYVFTGDRLSDLTSIGCHTFLWDFTRQQYAQWLEVEQIARLLAPIVPSDQTKTISHHGRMLAVGPGIHDSSAALIPYLLSEREPFVLLSTGTWSISLNPFNRTSLTTDELLNDCLCYLSWQGHPVKASRLFAGNIHDTAVAKLSEHFHRKALSNQELAALATGPLSNVSYSNPSDFACFEDAYLSLIHHLTAAQYESTKQVIRGSDVKHIFVDGGFARNPVFMKALAQRFKEYPVYAASVPQASALGAALVIHSSWNKKSIPTLVHRQQVVLNA